MRRTSEAGFTLLEILVGLAISAAIMAVLVAVLRLGYSSEEKGRERAEYAQVVRTVTDRLSWLLRGAYPYRFLDKELEKEVLYFEGGGDTVRFVTTSTDAYSEGLNDMAGLKSVLIYVGSDGLHVRESMFFDADREGLGEPMDEAGDSLLAAEVTEVSFEYLATDPDTGDQDWEGSWDTTDSDFLPSAVKVMLTVRHKGEDHVLPPVIAAIRSGGPKGRLTSVPGL